MKARLVYGAVGFLLVAVMLVAVPACSKEEQAAKEPAAKEAVKKAAEAVKDVTDDAKAVEAKLAAADAVDGTTDKIVSKCAACALGMDGKAEHTLEVSGYKLYFCTEDCKARFDKDANKAILDLEIPEG